jgi:RHS repeat-associated protein
MMPVSTGNSQQHYRPFGETIEAPKDDVGYTGHKFDTDLGLSYMQARYFNPVTGRFLSNDPVSYIAANPVMSFNRYMYVNNNPYKYTDPDGKFFCGGACLIGGAIAIARFSSIAYKAYKTYRAGAAAGLATAVVLNEAMNPETELVRGGDGSKPFSEGTGVTPNSDGTLDGVSVNGEDGVSGSDSAKNGKVRNGRIRIGTVGEVEAAGGVVIPDGKERGNNHCTINGCTEVQLNDIFNKPIPNPAKVK